uniref:SWIM-type domain-containing protein n=1 Tax=Amphiprion percula TaxID=161767 RepID=A0A3P8SFY7_AMPPE
ILRRTVWRNTVSDAVSLHQGEALSTTMFLLKPYGPTGFLLREEGQARSFKVCLGDQHSCTCPEFTKEQEPCKHICWVLLRKFRLPREHEYSFQRGLMERQILELLHGLHQTKAQWTEFEPSAASLTPNRPDREEGRVCRKAINAQDVCPICQKDLLERKQPVSYCRFSCGNNVHISYMKVWADHQNLSHQDQTVKCPLCREDFSSLKLLQEQQKNAAKLFMATERQKPDRHLGVVCHSCRIYYCTHTYSGQNINNGVSYWIKIILIISTWGNNVVLLAADPLPDAVLKRLPAVRLRSGSRLLDEGQQCRICLQSFILGQHVRSLPCHHQVGLYRTCAHTLSCRNLTPLSVDGYIIYNPLTWRSNERKTSLKSTSKTKIFLLFYMSIFFILTD